MGTPGKKPPIGGKTKTPKPVAKPAPQGTPGEKPPID